MGMTYEMAVRECSNHGENLIQIDQLDEALELLNNSRLNSNIRLDAISNETCFKDQQGMDVDLESHGFGLNISQPVMDFGLSADGMNGSISLVRDNEVLVTVCQIPKGVEENDIEVPGVIYEGVGLFNLLYLLAKIIQI